MEKHFHHGATIFRGVSSSRGVRKSISKQLDAWFEQQGLDICPDEMTYRVSFERKAPGYDVFCQAEIQDGEHHLWTSVGAGVTASEALARCLRHVHTVHDESAHQFYLGESSSDQVISHHQQNKSHELSNPLAQQDSHQASLETSEMFSAAATGISPQGVLVHQAYREG